jgi:hypothetical protein
LAAHAAYLRHLGTATDAEVIEADGLYGVRSGLISNTENGVVSGAGTGVGSAAAQELIGWFHEWKVPAWWLCAEGDSRADTAAWLQTAGWEPERLAWEMRVPLRALDLDAAAVPANARIALWHPSAASICGSTWRARTAGSRRRRNDER